MSDTIRLLVRVDDAGSSWAANLGCFRACTEGVARSIEVMLPCAWIPHASRLFATRPELDIGIHLTLSSEWDAVKWRPLTRASSLVDDRGNLFPLLLPRAGDPRPSLADSPWSMDDVARELRAQIHAGMTWFPQASHVSTHMARHFGDFAPRVGELVSELCEEFGLMDAGNVAGLSNLDAYPDTPHDADHRIPAFVSTLSELSPGTYLFVDHPVVDSPELDDIGHRGYENVRQDRLSCFETLISEALCQQVRHRNIELIRYCDL